jgi:hypothetical protein
MALWRGNPECQPSGPYPLRTPLPAPLRLSRNDAVSVVSPHVKELADRHFNAATTTPTDGVEGFDTRLHER